MGPPHPVQDSVGFHDGAVASLIKLGEKVNFPVLSQGRSQSPQEICPLFTKGRELEATSAVTHQREMKIVFGLEKNPFESDTFASRI